MNFILHAVCYDLTIMNSVSSDLELPWLPNGYQQLNIMEFVTLHHCDNIFGHQCFNRHCVERPGGIQLHFCGYIISRFTESQHFVSIQFCNFKICTYSSNVL